MKRLTVWLAALLIATTLTLIANPTPANAYSRYSRETVMTWADDDYFAYHSVLPPAIIPLKVRHSLDVLYKYTHKPLKKPKIRPRKVVVCTTHLSRVEPPTGATPGGLIGYDYDITIRDRVSRRVLFLPELFVKYRDRQGCTTHRIPKATRINFGFLKDPYVEVRITEHVRTLPDLSHWMNWGSRSYKYFSPAYDQFGPWGKAP